MDNTELSNAEPSHHRPEGNRRKTAAAKWNLEQLRGLTVALRKNPEADLKALLPSSYTEKLQSYQRLASVSDNRPAFRFRDIRSNLNAMQEFSVLFPLSEELDGLLPSQENLSDALLALLAQGEVLYSTPPAMVLRVGENIAAKITSEPHTKNEHFSLQYLQEQLPTFPAPRPYGLVRFHNYFVLFTTYIPGLDLEKAWPQLDDTQKQNISTQLDKIFISLRSLPFPKDTPLGDIQGEGCMDSRRWTRTSTTPIMTIDQFEDFIFAGSKTASPVYKQLLRELTPNSTGKRTCVFTHCDVRPANIIVGKDEQGAWVVNGVVDWEQSGFYPEYWECIKITNILTPKDNFDWYKHLPECLSPARFPLQWLQDRVWERSLMNC